MFTERSYSITADLARLREAREFAVRAAADFGLEGDDVYDVKLAMSEAVTNAIQHGSRSTADRVRIAVLAKPGTLMFEVEDTGRFIPRAPRHDELPSGGRGLEFMRQIMDEVEVHPGPGGTLLRFAKRI